MRLREEARVGRFGRGAASPHDDSSSGNDRSKNGSSGWGNSGDINGKALIFLAVILFGIFVVWFVGCWIADGVRQRQQRLRGRGAQRELPAASPTGWIGTIVSHGPLHAAPIDERPCVAFGLTIIQSDGSPQRSSQTMLRDGATIGFEIALDSGEHARIPSGPCVLDMATARRAQPSPQLDDYLRTIDLQHGRGDDLELFPCDHVEVATLEPGDRVEILSPMTAVANPSTAPVTYREAAALVVPAGPVRLRPLPRSRDPERPHQRT